MAPFLQWMAWFVLAASALAGWIKDFRMRAPLQR